MNFNVNKNRINDTFAEINLSQLKRNFFIIKKHSGKGSDRGVKIC